jgi:EAL domain-containing protein (putative c-di-GMP-specific phosphodiesterase class I)
MILIFFLYFEQSLSRTQVKLKVIAEGVETQAQMDFLTQKNCDEIQGYFFNQPRPAKEIEQLLREINLSRASS